MNGKNTKSKIQNQIFSLHPKRYTLNAQKGFGLIEILIASAILSASLITLTATSQIAFRLMKESLERTQAGFLAEESIEVVRILRDDGWSTHIATLSLNVPHYLNFSTTTDLWLLSTASSSPIEGIFDRTVTFKEVYRRNSDGEIVGADSIDPKTLDPDTKHVTARVLSVAGKETVIETYITNIFQN